MDFKAILEVKLTFIKNYLRIPGQALTLSFDWFYVSEAVGEKDRFGHQTFKFVDLYKQNKDDIYYNLKKSNISVKTMTRGYIFTKC